MFFFNLKGPHLMNQKLSFSKLSSLLQEPTLKRTKNCSLCTSGPSLEHRVPGRGPQGASESARAETFQTIRWHSGPIVILLGLVVPGMSDKLQ